MTTCITRSESKRARRQLSRGLACAVATVLLLAAVARPAEAESYSVSLTASPVVLETAYSTTLTTTANRDLTATTYTTYLFDQSDPTWYRMCKVRSCSFQATHFAAGTHTYVAYVARDSETPTYPPARVRARSEPVQVTWSPSTFVVRLESDRTWLPPGSTATLSAQVNKDVAGTAVQIGIFDLTDRRVIAECTTGTTCTALVVEGTPTTRSYQAFVAQPSATPPPPNAQATSSPLAVTWSVLPDPKRPPNVGGGDLNATVHYSDPGVPALGEACRPTAFTLSGVSIAAWLSGSGSAYAGPAEVAGTGTGACETTSNGGGAMAVSLSGTSQVGTVSCPSLLGTFTRAATHITIVLAGDCTINEFEALRVGFVASGELVPSNEGGGISSPVMDATVSGGFVVFPT
jgi:hypothetical protein